MMVVVVATGAIRRAKLQSNRHHQQTDTQQPINWYQNATILDFIVAKDDGGGGNSWSYKTCKAPFRSPPAINQAITHWS